MGTSRALVVWLALCVGGTLCWPSSVGDAKDDDDAYTLPEKFLLGAGTSAYQTEGAWNVDGK